MTQHTTDKRTEAVGNGTQATVNYVYAIRDLTMKGVYTTAVMKQMQLRR